MYDSQLRTIIDPPLNWAARRLRPLPLTANQVTVVGAVFGFCAALAIFFGGFGLALVAIVANRLADGLDGALARQQGATKLGGFLDIVFDFFFYGAIPLAFALYDPERNALAAAVLLASFYANGATFLGFAAVAAELKRANPRLVIHVVGFGLAEGEAAQLSCIARNAGGRFLDAGSAEDLASAMTTVVETVAAEPAVPEAAPAPEPPPVVDTPAPEPPPAPVPEPPQVVRVGIAAVAGGLGRLVDAPVRWVVRDTAGVAIYEGESRGLSLDLAEGSYGVEAYAANARGGATIEVSGELGQEFDVEVDAGRLDLSLSAGKVAPPFSDLEAAGTVWTLEPRDGQGAVEMPKLARPSLLLAPGRYLVRARLKGLEAEAEAIMPC